MAPPTGKERLDVAPASALTWYIGFLQASCFSLVYFVAPFYFLSSVVILLGTRFSSFYAWLYSSPLILSALLPPMAMPRVLSMMQPMLTYFDSFEMIHEQEDWYEMIVEKQTNYILACQPHGVVTYVGILSGACMPAELRGRFPTAVADVLLKTPILKHVFGIFGMISAAKKSLVKVLTTKRGPEGTVIIYVGGMAELFLSDEKEEKLFLKKRKGFIKLALETGVDVVPVYMFGNTTVLSVMKHGFLSTLSRRLGASLTYMWGKWGLPIPRNDCKMLYVSGKPVGIPHIVKPTQQDIDKYHGLYCEQVQHLFEKYKEKVPEYKHKNLQIV